jgi:hypothetical protein
MSLSQTTSNSSPPELLNYVLLHGRYPVLEELIQVVRHQMKDLGDWLQIGRRYTAAQLMGSACWDMLTTNEKRLCGSVISHLTKEGQMPIMKCEKRSVGEVNSYVAGPDAEVWMLKQLGIRAVIAPSVMLADVDGALATAKE